MYVYLTDEVAKNRRFTTKYPAVGGEDELAEVGGNLRPSHRDGRWRVYLPNDINEIPEVLDQVVDEISFKEGIPYSPSRETGIYLHKDARAEITFGVASKDLPRMLMVHIAGKDLKNIRELFHQIRVGSIRPEESYEGEQSGKSRKELEAELARLKGENEDASQKYTRATEHFKDRVSFVCRQFRVIVSLLTDSSCFSPRWWPWCNKKLMVAELETVLRLCDKETEYTVGATTVVLPR
ncbi:MAG TPA: hypothetical protein VJZ94_00270 [Candidatus Paceibacterota bacterium]|uniref:Uncharacterized protein n=2 Tax=Candidatus Lloydiibacteriota TaxID=1817910 RepID=A0A1G2DCI2_9BACT|nr:MAG: hypothetical protein A3D67_01960 [Candidatus Lloydbacteria bacterium RIFCSPHIGHO2_02_FULL_51_22]OGZ15411.1 MAG: hypothetical protein A3J08_01865 [Candidatus Lloydbacteria bacterium RIFCSPLOWO2_02_FULL_51_11]HXK31175.1 hypothetical protein [Candidatus Paceibacterota bacterium]